MILNTPGYYPVTGSFVRLDPMTPAMLPELYSALSDPRVFAEGFAGGLSAFKADPEDFSSWAESFFKFENAQPYLIRTLVKGEPGEVIGTSSLLNFDRENRSCQLGLTAYDPKVWGTAVNPEVKLILLTRAFNSGLARVELQADELNLRSQRAIERLGAVRQRLIMNHRQRADGTWRNTVLYSIERSNWPKVRAGLWKRISEAERKRLGLSGNTGAGLVDQL